MISSDGIRGYNDMIILCLIYDEPSYGYEISKEIKKRTAGRNVTGLPRITTAGRAALRFRRTASAGAYGLGSGSVSRENVTAGRTGRLH